MCLRGVVGEPWLVVVRRVSGCTPQLPRGNAPRFTLSQQLLPPTFPSLGEFSLSPNCSLEPGHHVLINVPSGGRTPLWFPGRESCWRCWATGRHSLRGHHQVTEDYGWPGACICPHTHTHSHSLELRDRSKRVAYY